MNGRKMIKQITLSLILLINVGLIAQNQPDMTVLLDYFDSTVTIYVDGDEIVMEGDGVPSHFSPYLSALIRKSMRWVNCGIHLPALSEFHVPMIK